MNRQHFSLALIHNTADVITFISSTIHSIVCHTISIIYSTCHNISNQDVILLCNIRIHTLKVTLAFMTINVNLAFDTQRGRGLLRSPKPEIQRYKLYSHALH